jgi:hypothetical protein
LRTIIRRSVVHAVGESAERSHNAHAADAPERFFNTGRPTVISPRLAGCHCCLLTGTAAGVIKADAAFTPSVNALAARVENAGDRWNSI